MGYGKLEIPIVDDVKREAVYRFTTASSAKRSKVRERSDPGS